MDIMFLAFVLFASLTTNAIALPSAFSDSGRHVDHQLVERQRPNGGQFSMENWNDGTAKVNCRSGQGGSYTVSWSGNKGNFVCGKGYNSAEAR